MSDKPPIGLSPRERQIMDVVYRRGSATVQEVLEEMPDPPSYSAVRATMRVLEEKDACATRRKAASTSTIPPSPPSARAGTRSSTS